MSTHIRRDDSEALPPLMSVPDAAQQLAVSVRTVWRLISLGHLEVVRVAKCVRIKRSSLLSFLDRGGAR
jgi:excisionase family DNA binding protein